MSLQAILERTSIRGRVAFATACLEQALGHLSISGAAWDQLLNHLRKYSSSERLDAWEAEARKLWPTSPTDLPTKMSLTGLSDLDLDFLSAALEDVWDVATGNLYGGYQSAFTLEPALELAGRLELRGVPLPVATRFAKSDATEKDGWGNLVGPAFFA